MIRILTKDDLPAALEMIDLKSRTSGTVPVTKDEFIENFTHYFLGGESYALGYFEEGELITFLCIGFFESKMRGKFWVIPALYTKKFKQVFNFKDSDTALLLKEAFKFAEAKGYYEFYYSVSERIMNAYERQWQRNSVMETGRYDLILLDTIPPGTRPEPELYWRLMGKTVKPDPIIIKKRVLKEQYRNKVVLYTPLDIPKIEPNNWDEWWEVWNKYAGPSIKMTKTHNPYPSTWKGLELYRFTESSPILDDLIYECPRCPETPVTLDLIRQVKEYFPTSIRCIRVIENTSFVKFHSDTNIPSYQFRSLLWSTNKKLNWLLSKNADIFRPELPEDSNTFFYYDYHTKHCAPLYPNISKGLLQVFLENTHELTEMINQGARKYQSQAWIAD